MGRRKSPVIDSKRDVAPKENKGWIFLLLSSKWFVLLVLLLAGIVWYGFYTMHTKEIVGSDDREYVSIARNIFSGRGIVRNFIVPLELNFFGKIPVPEFFHPPGYPLIIAGFFKLFGISDFSALLPSYVSYFFLIILFFFFAKRYLEIKAATVATVILIFNREILDMSLVVLSEAVYTLIFFLFFVLMVKARSLKDIFVGGLVLGVSHLIRENIYPYSIAIFVYLCFYPDLPRRKKMMFFTIGILIPIFPKMIRTFLVTGSPFFSYAKIQLMAFTDKYPWINIWRDIHNPSFFGFLIHEPSQLILKCLGNWVSVLEGILSISNPYLLAFFMMEMFHWNIHTQWKKAKILFLSLFISQIFFISLINYDRRYFFPFLPVIIIFGSESFLRISGTLVSGVKSHWKNTISSLIILLFFVFFIMPSTYLIVRRSGPTILEFKAPQYGFVMTAMEAKKLNDFLRRELKENQIVWTDFPEILEWEGDRLCGWLPTKIEYIYEIHKKIPVDAILLTNARTLKQMEEEWQYLLLSNESLPQYRNVKLYVGKKFFAKLLIRDGRE
jgi:4-amino-4-deoxy-L-arabinose transferase-like glycosyltransferase